MKKDKKKGRNNKSALRVPRRDDKTKHSNNEIGLPEDIRVVHSEEPNPHDG